MASNDPFGFDPEDLDRLFPGASDQLRGALGEIGKLLGGTGGLGGAGGSGQRPGWSVLFDQLGGQRRTTPVPEQVTTGETGDGVWVIYTVNDGGGAQIEQVYATELDALRANKHNVDSTRKVRFLPYGMAVTVLDLPELTAEDNE